LTDIKLTRAQHLQRTRLSGQDLRVYARDE